MNSSPLPGLQSKLLLLANLLLKNPAEFKDRVMTAAEYQTDRLRAKARSTPVDFEFVIGEIGRCLGGDIHSLMQESPLTELEKAVNEERDRVLQRPAFGVFHAADLTLARLCYAICRLQKPTIVVETGVAYGMTSAFILQALSTNRQGELWSIDMPPLATGADEQIGRLIPVNLRSRWHLIRGTSRSRLPHLMTELPHVDVFLHDSLHTYNNMTLEFRTVWPKLTMGGILLSDDVELNQAFEKFAGTVRTLLSLTSRQQAKNSLLGVLIKAN